MMMLFFLLYSLPLAPAMSPTCMTNYGKTVCGYHCLAAHGEVACAKTSAGICGATETELTCWDPPDSVRAHYGDKVPRPKCLTRFGSIACGYDCASREGDKVYCAQTADGICVSTWREVVCWDPPIYAYCADDKPLPRPKCVTIDGHAACGYGCADRNGEIQCASTPGGRCEVVPSQIICTDPETPPMCGVQPCKPDDPTSGRWWCRPPPPKK
jgi:hypothetical protein